MSYQLIGSPRSPFVRICRMLMIQNNIDYQFRALDFVNNDEDAKQLSRETPINKVPVLIDGSQKIFDSRVIIHHLTRQHSLPSLSLEQENQVSVIYGALDAGVILFLMKKDGFDINADSFFLSRNRQRIPEALNYLSSWAQSLDVSKADHWNYPSMALYSFLYWSLVREVLRREDLSSTYLEFLENFKIAKGVAETGF